MSAARQSSLHLGASTAVLGAASDPAPVVVPRLADGEMGDAASNAALARLNLAVGELKARSTIPFLRRAIDFIAAENPQAAAEAALKALEIDERSGIGWHLLAIAREKAGDFRSSIQCYESALALTPDQTTIAGDLGRLAFRLNMKPIAAQLFAHYCAANPTCAMGASNLACALRDLHDYSGAIQVLKSAIDVNPDSSSLWNTLGTVLSEQGDPKSALTFFDEALRCDPAFAKARYNRANTLLGLGDPETALAECEQAMTGAETPSDLAMMKLARSSMLFCLGRIGEGWDAYQVRLDKDFAGVTNIMVDRPRWNPDSELAGKRLLVVGEQGLGDEVSFATVIPDVLEALGPDGHLTLALEPRLIPLYQRSFPGATIGGHSTLLVDGHTIRGVPFVKDPSVIDLWAPLADLPRRFRRTIEDYPARGGYLTADPTRVEHWRGVLAELPGPKVGILWKSLKLDGARLRQFSPFERWRPVLETKGVSFVNMQYGECEAELAQARETLGLDIWTPPGINLKNDLDDVAALSCALDLTIGPANATTNIAAACGGVTWMVSTPGAWSLLGADWHPWYPQVRIFASDRFNHWAPVMRDVADALAQMVPPRAD